MPSLMGRGTGCIGRTGSLCLALGLLISEARAETTASFQLSATVVEGCEINAALPANGQDIGQIGTIDFGSHSALSTETITAALVRNAGISLSCTPSVSLSMTLDGGLHADAARNLQHVGGPERIAYRLYGDASFTQELTANQPTPISFSNPEAIALPIYGQLTLPGDKPPGVYSDTVMLTLTW